MTKARQGKRLNKRLILTLLVSGALLVALFVSYEIYQSHKRQKRVVIPSSSPVSNATTNPKPSDKQVTQSTQPSTNSTPTTQKSTTATTGATPIVPSGQFVSNHSPGGSNPTTEQSVCNTTAGASCYIQFTKDSIVKKLDSQVTDANGTTIWNWDVKAAGLTAGSWHISAVATLNGQAVSAQDSQTMEIK